jgi:hypothetical protein
VTGVFTEGRDRLANSDDCADYHGLRPDAHSASGTRIVCWFKTPLTAIQT